MNLTYRHDKSCHDGVYMHHFDLAPYNDLVYNNALVYVAHNDLVYSFALDDNTYIVLVSLVPLSYQLKHILLVINNN